MATRKKRRSSSRSRLHRTMGYGLKVAGRKTTVAGKRFRKKTAANKAARRMSKRLGRAVAVVRRGTKRRSSKRRSSRRRSSKRVAANRRRRSSRRRSSRPNRRRRSTRNRRRRSRR